MLPEIRIASPCTANWDNMAGDDRIRYCEQCRLNVYNFSAMTNAEIENLISHRNGRLCARFYQRADGTILTQNCPVGFRAVVRRVSRVAGAALTAMMSVSSVAAQKAPDASSLVQIKPSQTGISLTVMDKSGAVIPGATVIVSEVGKSFKIDGLTDPTGVFQRFELSPGSYKIKVRAFGFVDGILKVQLRQGEVTDPRIQLEIGQVIVGDVVDMREPLPEPATSNNVPDHLNPDSSGNNSHPGPTPAPHKNPVSRLIHKLGF